MRLTKRDAVATALVALVIVPYIGYLVRGSMPFIQDPRGMAATGLVGLTLALIAWGRGLDSTMGRVLMVFGIASLGLGVAAILIGAEGSEILLAVFISSIGLVWLTETMFDAGLFSRIGSHHSG